MSSAAAVTHSSDDEPHLDLSGDVSGDDFVPYVRAEEQIAEMTLAAVVLGLIQAIVFGVADAYLGLKVGMTVGASIPAAVISMAVLRFLLKRGTVLENNVVQNMASVGESLASGAVFTIPALFILAASLKKEGAPLAFDPAVIHIFFIASLGGLLGILFMIPLRRSLIVKEHGKLRYPEGTACAEVLMAGDKGGESAATVFKAILVAGAYRVAMNGMALFRENVAWGVRLIKDAPKPTTEMSFDMLPSLLAVGFIIGLRTSAFMLSGALLGWYVIIPTIAFIGAHAGEAIYPGTDLIRNMDPGDVRLAYLRYIGAGAVAMGGIVSLCKALPTIIESFGAAAKEIISSAGGAHGVVAPRTSRDIPSTWVLGGSLLLFLLITALLYGALVLMHVTDVNLPMVAVAGGMLAVVFAFFFVSVSSRIVGIVGTTSMPLSGMTIGALIATCVVLKWLHLSGSAGILATLVIGAIVCIAISIGGDISQDLKIGFLVGATPRVVQTTQMLSVLIAAVSVSFVVLELSPLVVKGQLEAPQANLMYLLARGIMGGQLPWMLIIIGMAVAGCVEMMGLGSLPFAVGLYLPLDLSTTVMIGGVLHYLVLRSLPPASAKAANDHGLLASSGMVAGDALVGVVLGIMAARDIHPETWLFPRGVPWQFENWPTVIVFGLLTWYLWRVVMVYGRTHLRSSET